MKETKEAPAKGKSLIKMLDKGKAAKEEKPKKKSLFSRKVESSSSSSSGSESSSSSESESENSDEEAL